MAENNSPENVSDKAADLKSKATETANAALDAASSKTRNFAGTAKSSGSDLKDAAKDKAQDLKATAAGVASDLKSQASAHVGEAKDIVTSMANEARSRISDIVDQQKTAGADHLSTLSQAAQHAAEDLNEKNPQVARLVRDAATTVDRFAGDLRSSNLSDVVASVSSFARSQPVAFFAGSVLAGFVLARFLKSEPTGDRFYDQSSLT